MYECMYVCVCECVYVCMYMCMYVCVCECMNVCMCVCMYVCMGRPRRRWVDNIRMDLQEVGCGYTRCGNEETGLLLLLISGQVDDEEEGRALTRGLPSTVTQRFIHAHRLVWP